MEKHERKSVRWILVFIISIFTFIALCYNMENEIIGISII